MQFADIFFKDVGLPDFFPASYKIQGGKVMDRTVVLLFSIPCHFSQHQSKPNIKFEKAYPVKGIFYSEFLSPFFIVKIKKSVSKIIIVLNC